MTFKTSEEMIHDTWFTNYHQLLSTCFCIGTSQSEMLAKAAVALTILAFQVDNRHEFRCRSGPRIWQLNHKFQKHQAQALHSLDLQCKAWFPSRQMLHAVFQVSNLRPTCHGACSLEQNSAKATQISVIFQGPGQQWPNLQNLSKSEGIAKINGITFALYLWDVPLGLWLNLFSLRFKLPKREGLYSTYIWMKSYEIRWSNLDSSGYLGSLSGDQKAKKLAAEPEVEKCYWILVSIEDSRLLQPQKEGNSFWNKLRLDCWISSNMSKGRHETFNTIWESFIACGVATCGSTQFYHYRCAWPAKQFTSCHAMWLLRCKDCKIKRANLTKPTWSSSSFVQAIHGPLFRMCWWPGEGSQGLVSCVSYNLQRHVVYLSVLQNAFTFHIGTQSCFAKMILVPRNRGFFTNGIPLASSS